METDQAAKSFVERLKKRGITRAFALYTDATDGLEKILVYDDGEFLLLDVKDHTFGYLSVNAAYLLIERMNTRTIPVRGMGAFKKPLDVNQREALRYEFSR